jgi:Tfp pilus assembly protein PilN
LSASGRRFGALLSHDTVCLVEYRVERGVVRVVDQWMSSERSSSIDEALTRLIALVSARNVTKPRVAIAIEQFGVFHHVMDLPAAGDDVLSPIVRREVQRLYGLPDPVVSFTRGLKHERREPARADLRTAPLQILIAGAPRETVDTLQMRLAAAHIDVDIATVVPKAIHSLYKAASNSLEPTAVLVALEGGPHLSFFLEGGLELAIDPPIALEGERASIPMILDQVERGAVYFRQQFRGATASRLFLSAPINEYEGLSAALQERMAVHVHPLFPGATTPEAVVAMGAVLEAKDPQPLDLFPHPPTFAERAREAMQGPNAIVASVGAAAVLAAMWAGFQVGAVSSARRESEALRASISSSTATVAPMRQIAERRADYAHQVDFVRATYVERAALTATLHAIADQAPNGVQFDSLRVSRTADGWASTIVGEAVGATAAQTVRGLDAFYQSIRRRPLVKAATLDDFDYPTTPAADSTASSTQPVKIQFRLSFTLERAADLVGAVR